MKSNSVSQLRRNSWAWQLISEVSFTTCCIHFSLYFVQADHLKLWMFLFCRHEPGEKAPAEHEMSSGLILWTLNRISSVRSNVIPTRQKHPDFWVLGNSYQPGKSVVFGQKDEWGNHFWIWGWRELALDGLIITQLQSLVGTLRGATFPPETHQTAVMSNSKEQSLDENVVFLEVTESSPEFLYSERERQAVERLLSAGPETFYSSIGTERSGCFLSPEEVRQMSSWAQDYHFNQVQWEEDGWEGSSQVEDFCSTYFPCISDTPAPDLDLGWPEKGPWQTMGSTTVHTSPPAEGEPPVREIIRQHLQRATRVCKYRFNCVNECPKCFKDGGWGHKWIWRIDT